MEAPDVVRHAGCETPTKTESVELQMAENQRKELERTEREMADWREGRAVELDK